MQATKGYRVWSTRRRQSSTLRTSRAADADPLLCSGSVVDAFKLHRRDRGKRRCLRCRPSRGHQAKRVRNRLRGPQRDSVTGGRSRPRANRRTRRGHIPCAPGSYRPRETTGASLVRALRSPTDATRAWTVPQEADIDLRWWSGLPSTRGEPSLLGGERPDPAMTGHSDHPPGRRSEKSSDTPGPN